MVAGGWWGEIEGLADLDNLVLGQRSNSNSFILVFVEVAGCCASCTQYPVIWYSTSDLRRYQTFRRFFFRFLSTHTNAYKLTTVIIISCCGGSYIKATTILLIYL